MDLLEDVVILFGTLVMTLSLCKLLRIPLVLGFLLGGVLCGPHGLGWVSDPRRVEALSEIGVALLLFSVGMEFSPQALSRISKAMFVGGSLQVSFTVLIIALVGVAVGLGLEKGLFWGMVIALSSTAIVIKSLQEKTEMDSPHGQVALGILIFQDLMIVPMMLTLPTLSALQTGAWDWGMGLRALKGVFVMLAATLMGWIVAPRVLFRVATLRSREMFLLTVLGFCFFMTWFAHRQGLSPAIGALLGGLVISQSELSHEAMGNILPFRDVFMSFFFASIGMLLQPLVLLQEPLSVGLGCLGVVAFKATVITAVGLALNLPLKRAVTLGVGLSQIGELSLILANSGQDLGLISMSSYQALLGVSVITMGMTPFLIRWGHTLGEKVQSRRWLSRRVGLANGRPRGPEGVPEGHLVVVGFGLNGRNIVMAAKAAGIPYVIVEMNPNTVREQRSKGEPIVFGDASYEPVLEAAHVERAKVLVIVINDPGSVRGIIKAAKGLNPGLHVIVRTRYLEEVEALYRVGADEVIPEEFETSVEIFARVMRLFLVPESEVEKMVQEIRSEGYQMLRSLSPSGITVCDLGEILGEVEVRSIRVAEGSPLAGKTLTETALRRRHGATVMAIKRGHHTLVDPDPEFIISAGDILVVMADAPGVREVARLASGKGN